MVQRTAIGVRGVLLCVVLLLTAAACADDMESSSESASPTPTPSSEAGAAADDVDGSFPDVIDADLERSGDTWTLSATISSPYDSPERYADAFRAVAPDGTELGLRVLTHDHANEQPFTRSLTGLVIPDGIEEITVEGRDLANGWGGQTVTVAIPD
ncbi:hypothetical protein DVS28_a0244 [Euzebya pacifica]|uniref:Secreted protein n=1 Tax=Euzebya pacifica TaxID=1608957 RepID=A0A346XRV4_9ACTN|nr:hypothetical protein [Euzebya pacifica]AXV04951.1 hypothetical protein DVS28_a0244 [Euzebya pacifica]